MKKLGLCIVLLITVLALTLTATGCSLLEPKPKTFSKAGMSITLTESFVEQDLITQTAYYVSMNAVVTALKEDGSSIPNYSVKDYAELVCQANGLNQSSVIAKDGYAEFTYEKEVSGKEYYYYARCFKNGTDFWLFQFACETKNTEDYTERFEAWASSVTFDR